MSISVPVALDGVVRHVQPGGSFSPSEAWPVDPPDVDVAVAGYGELATSVARALTTLGPRTLTMIDDFGSTTAWQRELAYDAVKVRGRLEALADAFDLVVVASPRVEPDRGYAELLSRNGIAQLYVRGQGPAASVGPLVVPGRTACLHCADHTIADADPRWSPTLLQLVRETVPMTGLARAWASAMAAREANCYLCLGEATSINGMWRMCQAEAQLSVVRLAPHPRCWCKVAQRASGLRALPDVATRAA